MRLLWALLWSLLPRLVLCVSAPGLCRAVGLSSSSVSPALDSLQCYNDYVSQVSCRWRTLRNSSAELWLETGDGRSLCVPDVSADSDFSSCRFKAQVLAIGVKHTAFFLKNETLDICSSRPKSLVLSHHLRARPPVHLSTHRADDGGQVLQWSSPYPPSSALNTALAYQLSYRALGLDEWTTQNVSGTSVKLSREPLLPGHRYEARARTKAAVGQWSVWSRPVTWTAGGDGGPVPEVVCELVGDGDVVCSWDLSTETSRFVSFTLVCRRNLTAASEPCCTNTTVRPDSSGTRWTFSCSLKVSEPEHVLLDLQPTLNTKTFDPSKTIRPSPPQNVNVRETEDGCWLVEWTKPVMPSGLRLSYQVLYYRTEEQGSQVLLNISEGSMSLTIPGLSLVPSQGYQVKVRSLVVPGSSYEGVPSEWSDLKEWTSNKASFVLPYILTAAIVASVFLTLYFTVPACQRKVVLWVDSVPSPGKSKILSEIKSSSSRTLVQTEDMSICKVQQLDNVSTCSSEALLWSSRDAGTKSVDQDEGCWSCDNLPSPADKFSGSDTSSMSFSGPYIFCQSADMTSDSMEETEDRRAADVPVNLVLFGEGYVCLPSLSTTRSTQDLASHSQDNSTRPSPDTAPRPVLEPQQDQPPDYYSGPFPSWPPGGSVQASGYCHLPTAFMRAAP